MCGSWTAVDADDGSGRAGDVSELVGYVCLVYVSGYCVSGNW